MSYLPHLGLTVLRKARARRGLLSDDMVQGSQPWWRRGVCGGSRLIAMISPNVLTPLYPYLSSVRYNSSNWSVLPHSLILNLALSLALANDMPITETVAVVSSLASLPLPGQYALDARRRDTWNQPV